MTSPSHSLRVHEEGSSVTYRVAGRATMHQSVALRRLGEEALARGATSLAVDLRHCVSMDSTFIGTLLILFRAAGRVGDFHLASPSPECRRCLELMGLGDVFRVVNAEELPEDAWRDAEPVPQGGACLKYAVLDSHRELADLGGPAAGPCRAVADTLAKELEAEGAAAAKDR